ncbi:MAG: FAD-dependent thymidylate synthase [Clostridiales bacterium]|nr:FAD-dependent thymidylate synthase [Clostridiales bacterium]
MLRVELLTYTPDAEKVVAAAAKLCYAKSDIQTLMDGLTPEKTDSFLALLSSLGHESPVEHASYTFGVDGVSRALLAQLTRHRIASFSVQSQRYVDKSHFSYVVPPEIEAIPEAKAEFIRAMEEDAAHYEKLKQTLQAAHVRRLTEQGVDAKEAEKTAEKMANEDARFVLPNACETRLIMTMNVRSLYHFFNLRCCMRAQWEIRELAWLMLAEVKRVSPALFRTAGPSCVGGACPEGRMSCGRMAEMRARAEALGQTDETI